MGIHADSFVYKIPEDCYCILCNLVLEDPVEFRTCGHHFCNKCFNKWREDQVDKNYKNVTNLSSNNLEVNQSYDNEKLSVKVECPYCGMKNSSSEIRKDRLVWNLIQNMNIYCINKKHGCSDIFKLGFRDLHQCDHEKKQEKIETKCKVCNISITSDKQHDCIMELLKLYKHTNIQLVNAEHENSRLKWKLTTREKEYMEDLTKLETQCHEESLKYNKEIRELRTRTAMLQGEVGRKKGLSEVKTMEIDVMRINGSLGFNIIGGATENPKTSSGIYVSRIVEGGAADQPDKLQLHDRILKVDGIDLEKAAHELAVQTFKNSGDPVKMIVQREIIHNRHSDATTQTYGVIFAVSCDDPKESNVNINEKCREFSSNKSKWINPQDIIDSVNLKETLEDVVNEVDETKVDENKDEIKSDLYDSAYDTLLTQKSSRSCRSPPAGMESENSLTPSTFTEDYTQDVVMRKGKNNKDNSGNRSSTFYVIPGDEVKEEDASSLNNTWEDMQSPTENGDDFEEYEYEEVTLTKSSDEKFGLLLCYGGDENDVAVYVGDVEENSVADMNGRIMVGDQIVRINHKHVNNVEEAYKMMQQNNNISLIVGRAVYEPQSEFYDEAEETDLDLLEIINEEEVVKPHPKSREYSSSISSKSSEISSKSNESVFHNSSAESSCVTKPIKLVSPEITASSLESSNGYHPQKQPLTAFNVNNTPSSPCKSTRESKKHGIKHFVKQKLSNSSTSNTKKGKRTESLSDDSNDSNKITRCDSHSSNGSSGKNSSNVTNNEMKIERNDLQQIKLKDPKQLSRMKAYLDSPSLIRHRVNNNNIIENQNINQQFIQHGVLVGKGQHSTLNPLTHDQKLYQSIPLQGTFPSYPGYHISQYNHQSGPLLRSAMKTSQNSNVNKSAKKVQIDPHHGWNDTEKRVWEEFKIIQSMEAKDVNKKTNEEKSDIEAEWRVRRSKDGKHIYIKKTSSSRNKILKQREEQIKEERCGITTDDDAFTVYQGQYWDKNQRKRQLSRHNDRRQRLMQKSIKKQSYENKTGKVLNEMAQRNMVIPGNIVFDNFITVEEILSQRNRAGIFEGPVHVTTI